MFQEEGQVQGCSGKTNIILHIEKICRCLNVRRNTIKLPGDNIGENLDNHGHDNDFLDTTPNTQSMKDRLNKLNFINIKTSVL